MSGRPVPFKPFAQGSYPIGSSLWSSTLSNPSPLRVVDSHRAFMPERSIGAQELNQAFSEPIDNCATLLAFAGQHSAMNWSTIDAAGVTPNKLNAAYDPKWGRWLISGYDTAHSGFCVATTANCGRTFIGSGQQPATPTTATGFIGCAIPNPSGQIAVAAYTGSGAPGAVVDEVTRLAIVSPTAKMVGCYLLGKYCCVGFDNATTLLATSTGGAWTTTAGSPIAAWTTAASNAFIFYTCQSATKAIFCARGASTSDQIIAFDGLNFAYLGQVGVAAGWILTGLAWDGTNFLASATNGTDSRVYSSPDGVTWTSPGLATGIIYEGVAALGSLVFLVATDTRRGTHGQFSVDSGQTFTAGTQFSTTGTAPFRVLSGTRGFAVMSGGVISFSQEMGA